MTVLVTGATGFIGKHLVDALAAGGAEIRCLTRGNPPADRRPNVTFHRTDYDRSDLGISDDVLRGVTTVFHLAGATRGVSFEDFRRANVEASERLLDRLVAAPVRPRFVHVSSQAAAGPARDAEHPRTEGDPEAPIEGYGKSKLAAERMIRARASEIDATIVRPVAVYGPGDQDFLSIFTMMKKGVAVYPGTRHASINTVYVKDLVAGLIAAAGSSNTIGKTYFLGDDRPVPWREIYSTIGETAQHAPQVEINIPHGIVAVAGKLGDLVGSLSGRPSLLNSNKAMLAAPRYWLCSSARAKEDFGFATPTSLRDGMRVTYDWYLRHRWL